MVKRRRERDRPKAGPAAPYNPNKRIQLSYESSEDHDGPEEQRSRSPSPDGVEDATTNNETMTVPNAIEGDEVLIGASEDGEGNDNLEDEPLDDEAEDPPRHDSAWSRGEARKNNTTGQWPALGSLSYSWEDEGDEEDFDSEEEEAMAYLRAVRSERQSMPEVLTASKTYSNEEIYGSGMGDTRGYIDDGAYVARASIGPSLPNEARTTLDPKEVFTNALKGRFLQQRYQMHLSPSVEKIAALDDNHPISFPRNNEKAYAEWRALLLNTVPQPAQVRAMEQDTVYLLLKLIQEHYLARGKQITVGISSWIWALLSRLDDVGSMNNHEVSIIREFGKKGVLVQLSFFDAAAAKQLERAAADEAGGSVITTPKDKDTADARSPDPEDPTEEDCSTTASAVEGASNDTSGKDNTLATLDSIIVVVGEIFGQRDLLEFRQPWISREAG